MNNAILGFVLKLMMILAIVFGLHLIILNYQNLPLFDNLIVKAYSINFALAIIIYVSLFLLQKKYEHLLGFIFMAGSLFKFAVFFVFFYPTYRLDGDVSSLETVSFLTPYISCLFIETYFLVRLLNNKI